jgi:hypothetical protein
MLPTLHDVVPLAVPLPPRLLDQVTWVTPTLSEAEPPRLNVPLEVVWVEALVGELMVTLGAVVSPGVLVE